MASLIEPATDLPGADWTPAVDALILRHDDDVLGLLLAINEAFGFLPRNALAHVAQRIGVPLARLFGVASFYSTFRLEPRGRRTVVVCHGTACHVAGGPRLTKFLEHSLGVELGRTHPDGSVTLESVACVGCCSLAPVIRVQDRLHGRVRASDLDSILLVDPRRTAATDAPVSEPDVDPRLGGRTGGAG